MCDAAKAAGMIVMTVSLDLSYDQYLRRRNRRADLLVELALPQGPTTGKPTKLFWNATGSNLADKFKEIADELSNLRIVG